MKKIASIILLIFGIIIPISCEDSIFLVDCDNCMVEKPSHTNLKIKVTINDENQSVPITIYLGTIEDGVILKEDIATKTTYYYYAEVGNYYSVVVKYFSKGKVIYAVDGKKLWLKKDNSSCDSECYNIVGDNQDLRLK